MIPAWSRIRCSLPAFILAPNIHANARSIHAPSSLAHLLVLSLPCSIMVQFSFKILHAVSLNSLDSPLSLVVFVEMSWSRPSMLSEMAWNRQLPSPGTWRQLKNTLNDVGGTGRREETGVASPPPRGEPRAPRRRRRRGGGLALMTVPASTVGRSSLLLLGMIDQVPYLDRISQGV